MSSTNYNVIDMEDRSSLDDNVSINGDDTNENMANNFDKTLINYVKQNESNYEDVKQKNLEILFKKYIRKELKSSDWISQLESFDWNIITEINLENNQIETLPIDLFKGCHYLNKINFDSNLIEQLPDDILNECVELKDISFKDNKLKQIPESLFKHCKFIQKVNFESNKLLNLPAGLFEGCIGLIEVCFNENLLTKLPDNLFKDCLALNNVYFERNKLEVLSEFLVNECTALKSFCLNNNQLKELPRDLFKTCKSLYFVNLSENKLKNLADDIFDNCTTLNTVSFDKNQLEKLPNDLFKKCSMSLSGVLFEGNQIEEIPENFFNGCIVLKWVSFVNNKLKKLPNKLFQGCALLKYVNFSMNQLEFLPSDIFNDCKRLANVVFDENLLSELPYDLFRDCVNLSSFSFSLNQIKILPDNFIKANDSEEINYFSNLKRIDLSHNLLERLPAKLLDQAESLNEINLSNNRIKELVKDLFVKLNDLEEIDFSNNQLAALDNDFNHKKYLKRITFSDNKLSEINLEHFKYLNASCVLDIRNNIIDINNSDLIHREFFEAKKIKFENFEEGDDERKQIVELLDYDEDKFYLIKKLKKYNKMGKLLMLFLSKKCFKHEDIYSDQHEINSFQFRFNKLNSNQINFLDFLLSIEDLTSDCLINLKNLIKNKLDENSQLENFAFRFTSADCIVELSKRNDINLFDNFFPFDSFKAIINLFESEEIDIIEQKSEFKEIANTFIFHKKFREFYLNVDYSKCFKIALDHNNEQTAIRLLTLMKFIVSFEMKKEDNKNLEQLISENAKLNEFNSRFLKEFLVEIFERKWKLLIKFILDNNSADTKSQFIYLKSSKFNNKSKLFTNDKENEDILLQIKKLGDSSILRHQTTKDLLEERWAKSRLFYYLNLILYLAFLICYSINIESFGKNFNAPTQLEFVTRIVSIIFVVYFIVLEILQFLILCQEKVSSYKTFKNLIEAITFPLSLATLCIITGDYGTYHTKSSLFSSTIILSYFILLCRLDKFWMIGSYVSVFGNIVKRSLKLVLIVFIFIVGFLLAFRNRTKMYSSCDSPDDLMIAFNKSFSASFMSLTTMAIGSVTDSDLGIENLSNHNVINFIMYLLFIFLLPILFLNTFTGISIDEVSKLIQTSEAKNILIKIDYVIRFENIKNSKLMKNLNLSFVKIILKPFEKFSNHFKSLTNIIRRISDWLSGFFSTNETNLTSDDDQLDIASINLNLNKILLTLNQQSNRINKIVADTNHQSNEINKLSIAMNQQSNDLNYVRGNVSRSFKNIKDADDNINLASLDMKDLIGEINNINKKLETLNEKVNSLI